MRVPVGTPYRALAALLLGAMAIALAYGWRAPLAGVVVVFGAVALLPALTPVYYNELLLPFVSPFSPRSGSAATRATASCSPGC